jgi:hypothetical protein
MPIIHRALMSMNQIDLFPNLIDQLVVDNYRVALSELKRLREARTAAVLPLA